MTKKTNANVNTMDQSFVPGLQADSKKEDIEIHLSPDEMHAGLFPFMGTVDSKTIMFIGSGSGFFFAGTKSEFLKLRDRIENGLYVYWKKSKARDVDTGRFAPLGERHILSAYKRLSDDGIIVILEGKEQGPYWTRDEFLVTYGDMLYEFSEDRNDVSW